jgi:hypothetical protein
MRLDIFIGHMTNKWNTFMKDQIKRTRMFFFKAKKGVMELEKDNYWHVWTHNSCPWLWRREIMQFKFQES